MLLPRHKPISVVSSVNGRPVDPPAYPFGLLFLIVGLGVAALGVKGAPPLDITGFVPRLFETIVGSVFGLVGALLVYLRYLLPRCIAEADLCQRLGVTPASLSRLAEERNVQPRIVSNGQPYFDPVDFGDVVTLLRPAAPADERALLRPAAGTAVGDRELLRPVQTDSAGIAVTEPQVEAEAAREILQVRTEEH